MKPPTHEQYRRMTDVSQNFGIPIRRASELDHNCPPSTVAFDAYKTMKSGIDATLDGVTSYCLDEFQSRGVDDILAAHEAEIQVYPKIDVFNPIWSGIPQVDTRIKTPFVDARDFLNVNVEDNTRQTLEAVRADFEPGSIPVAMYDAVLRTSDTLGMEPPASMDFLMKFVGTSFPRLAEYGGSMPEGPERSRVAFSGLMGDYSAVLEGIGSRVSEGEPLPHAARAVLRTFYDSFRGDPATSLVMDEREVLGMRDLGKVQRRPYSREELEHAQRFVDGDKSFTDAVTSFHYLLTDYCRNYFAEHPERMEHSFRDFNTLLLVYGDETGETHVSPNPDMLSSFSDNWFGAIARSALQRRRGEADSDSAELLTSDDIRTGILSAKDLSAFRMRIGMFRRDESGDVRWDGNMLRVCPAEKIATQAGAETVPRLYSMLGDANQGSAIIDMHVAAGEVEDSHQTLVEKLLERLHATNTKLFITGEAATGKSRVTQELARLTDLPVIDVGLGYRLAAFLKGQPSGGPSTDELLSVMKQGFTARTVDGECRIFDAIDQDITDMLRSSEMDQLSSSIGPEDDESILNFLREQVDGPFLVAARNTALADTGENSLQINLECSLEERARRRALQMGEKAVEIVQEELMRREQKSARHYVSDPSIIRVDSSELDIEQTVAEVMRRAYVRLSE